MVVESAVTHRDGASLQEGSKPGDVARGIEARGVVRMDTGGREYEARIFRGALGGNGCRLEGFTDANDRLRARVAGARDYLVAVAGERRVREVGVAVDED